ncbi:hypothetical protein DPEC_G00242870 [Dallia pectoralis]|uniref:Uncharacterized protein n=1 Tax=Dallia pectoralis TaxID=75939 RepID=A0ACC2FVC2_DALPE|nr:hypothetical protein DPEC_G00242870 [Dallia pectoralis]
MLFPPPEGSLVSRRSGGGKRSAVRPLVTGDLVGGVGSGVRALPLTVNPDFCHPSSSSSRTLTALHSTEQSQMSVADLSPPRASPQGSTKDFTTKPTSR